MFIDNRGIDVEPTKCNRSSGKYYHIMVADHTTVVVSCHRYYNIYFIQCWARYSKKSIMIQTFIVYLDTKFMVNEEKIEDTIDT